MRGRQQLIEEDDEDVVDERVSQFTFCVRLSSPLTCLTVPPRRRPGTCSAHQILQPPTLKRHPSFSRSDIDTMAIAQRPSSIPVSSSPLRPHFPFAGLECKSWPRLQMKLLMSPEVRGVSVVPLGVRRRRHHASFGVAFPEPELSRPHSALRNGVIPAIRCGYSPRETLLP